MANTLVPSLMMPTFSRAQHSAKSRTPKATQPGISTVIRAKHPWNAAYSTATTVSGSLTICSEYNIAKLIGLPYESWGLRLHAANAQPTRKLWLGLLQWHLMGPKQPYGSLHTHPLGFGPCSRTFGKSLNNQVEVSGAGGSKLGTGNLGQGTGDREGQGTGGSDLEIGNWGQGTGTGKWGQGIGGRQGTGGGESCTRESQMIRDFPDYRRAWSF